MTKGRILAIDFGLKRIGLAISDPLQIIASALDTFLASNTLKATVDALASHIQKLNVVEIVIGLPLMMNGTESERSGQVREFAKLLQEASGLTVHLFDERLSTVQADRALIETGFNRKKRAQVVDRVTAVLLLQTYLSQRGSR